MTLRRVIAMAYKEALQVWRDPRSLAIALALPLMQLAMLGYGVSLDIKHVPLCVYDQERSQLSRELIQKFVASGWFSAVRSLAEDRAVRVAMDSGECNGVLTVPIDFSRVLMTTGSAPIQAVFDATDANTTNIAIGYAQGVVAKAVSDFEAAWAASHGFAPSSVGIVDLRPRVWFNEGLDSRNFIIPGVVAIVVALVGAQLTSLTVSREWERGTMEQLISTPVKPLEVMIGKLAPYVAIALFDSVFSLLAAVFWFGVPFRGDVVTISVTTALFIVVVLGIGYVLSVRFRSQIGASQIALVLTLLPTVLLSGFTFPIDQMPAPIRVVTWFSFARYYVEILRSVFLKGSSLVSLWLPILALSIYAGAIVWIAARSFRKRLD
jgi:ABC-2 type transport system permease protein